LINQANNAVTNKDLSSQKILELMKCGSPNPTIDKFGQFFIEEYKHFIKVHNMAFPSQFTDQMSECHRPNIPDLDQNEQV
jgi:hypothetical protein